MQSCSPIKLMLSSALGGFLGGFLAAQHTASGFLAGLVGAGLILAVYWLLTRKHTPASAAETPRERLERELRAATQDT